MFSNGFSQVYSTTYSSGSTSLGFTANRNGDRFTLKVGSANLIQSGRNADAYTFFYERIRDSLNKRFSADIDLIKNEDFARKFAEEYRRMQTQATITPMHLSSVISRKMYVSHYELIEFKTGSGTYVVAFRDTLASSTVNILNKPDSVYRYDATIVSEDSVLEYWATIDSFIKKNPDKIKVPTITVISSPTVNKVFFEDEKGNVTEVNILLIRAKVLKREIAKRNETMSPTATTTSGITSATAVNVGTQPPKMKQLLEPQQIKCKGSTVFDIKTFTYPANGDSIQIEINSDTGMIKDTLYVGVSLAELKRHVKEKAVVKKLVCDSATIAASLEVYHTKLIEKIRGDKALSSQKSLLDSANKLLQQSRDSINQRIDILAAESDDAALLELVGDTIVLGSCVDAKQAQLNARNAFATGNDILIIDSVVIRIFNNTIHQLDVVGLVNGNKFETFSNNDYGISLRDLIDGGSMISVKNGSKEYKLCYANLFNVRPTGEDAISYNLRDGVYRFLPKPKNTQVVKQKRLLDFISASVFLDLQGFNASNSNKNLFTELYLNFNINDRRFEFKGANHTTPFKYMYTNISLATNIFKENTSIVSYRKPELVFRDSTKIDTATVPPFYRYDSLYSNKYYLKNFDLIKNSFLQIRPVFNIFSLDYKKARTILELNAGILFLGSNARVIDPSKGKDSVGSASVYSYSYLAELRLRVNPKIRYGIDLHLAYINGLRLLNNGFKSITGPYDAETLVRAKMTEENKREVLHAELNFFFNPKESKSNTDRGGIYFKLNMYKSLNYSEGFFMFLVGYSTDIKNFFK